MNRGLRRTGAIVAAIALVAACGPSRPPARDIEVKLAWSTDGVTLAGGHGTLTTDMGYVVDVDRFEVTAYSFEVVPCKRPPLRPPGAPPPPPQISLSLIATAWAGHRTDHPPTLTNAHRVEKPLLASELTLDHLRIPDVTYCSSHYLIGRLPDRGIDPADAGNIDVSLRIHGRYHKASEAAWTDFAVETPVSHGILVELKKEGWGKGLRVKNGDSFIVIRQFGRAFNGVDFANMPAPELARQILRELVAGTTVVHQHGPDG